MTTKTASSGEIDLLDRIAQLEQEVEYLKRTIDTKRSIQDIFKEYKLDQKGMHDRETIIRQKLNACAPENHVWLGVNAVLDLSIMAAHIEARDPALTNEHIRYNLGRETALEDFRNNLIG